MKMLIALLLMLDAGAHLECLVVYKPYAVVQYTCTQIDAVGTPVIGSVEAWCTRVDSSPVNDYVFTSGFDGSALGYWDYTVHYAERDVFQSGCYMPTIPTNTTTILVCP